MARTHVAAGPLRELMGVLSMPPAPRPLGQPVAVDVAVLATLGQLIPADAVISNDLAPRRRSFLGGVIHAARARRARRP